MASTLVLRSQFSVADFLLLLPLPTIVALTFVVLAHQGQVPKASDDNVGNQRAEDAEGQAAEQERFPDRQQLSSQPFPRHVEVEIAGVQPQQVTPGPVRGIEHGDRRQRVGDEYARDRYRNVDSHPYGAQRRQRHLDGERYERDEHPERDGARNAAAIEGPIGGIMQNRLKRPHDPVVSNRVALAGEALEKATRHAGTESTSGIFGGQPLSLFACVAAINYARVAAALPKVSV